MYYRLFIYTQVKVKFCCVSDVFLQLRDAIDTLDPARLNDLEYIENLLENIATFDTPKPGTITNLYQLYNQQISLNRTAHHSNIVLGKTYINFMLDTIGVSEIVTTVLAFQTKTARVVQTVGENTGLQSTTQYIAPQNTTYITIFGLSQDSGHARAQNRQLSGNASFVVSPASMKSACMEIKRQNKSTNTKVNQMGPSCSFHDRSSKKYSDAGCATTTDKKTGNVTCKCNHLTVFAVLLAVDTITIPIGVKVKPCFLLILLICRPISIFRSLIFQITSYTAESISIIFLVATIAILYYFIPRNDRVWVQISLSMALVLLHIVNMLHDLVALHEISCMIFTVINHYFLISSGSFEIKICLFVFFKQNAFFTSF